jgi:hypothetical protein
MEYNPPCSALAGEHHLANVDGRGAKVVEI